MRPDYIPSNYDPVKAHDYYERTKHLKGRKPVVAKVRSSSNSRPKPSNIISRNPRAQKAQARIGRLKTKLSKLRNALAETEAALSEKRQSARKQEKANSDGKTTVKERQQSKEYRAKHKQELAIKRQNTASSSSANSTNKSISDMSIEELTARANKIRATIDDARKQLSNATQDLGQLAHSALVSDVHVNELFAQIQSAERIPSK